MKINIGRTKPETYKEDWPGQYKFFSHYEYAAGIPQVLFIITTLKENGKPNLCFHSWSSFSGDHGGYFAVLTGLMNHSHTYMNITRDEELCINFISQEYYENAIKTITENELDSDEAIAGSFTTEPSSIINSPRIKEAFISYECKLKSISDLSGKGISSLVIGEVVNAAVYEGYNDISKICSNDGFMYNVHCPKDPLSGQGKKSAVTILKEIKILG